jgi:hypothetical protein
MIHEFPNPQPKRPRGHHIRVRTIQFPSQTEYVIIKLDQMLIQINGTFVFQEPQ